MSPAHRDPNRHGDHGGTARHGDPTASRVIGASGVAGTDDVGPGVAARRRGSNRLDALAGVQLSGAGTSTVAPRPRPGWCCYRAIGAADLPSWATEVALTIERLDLDPLGSAPLVLLRAPPRAWWLTYLSEAVAEVEKMAGVGPVAWVDTVAGARPGVGKRLLSGPALAGLTPVTPAVAQAGLAVAGARGLPAPLRRWRPAAGAVDTSWRSSAGAVVTCDGPGGVSAQAVVALGGLGNAAAITPPPGGALVLRAWRARRAWGVSCGLVLGAASALGLGREAGRVAAAARAEGWDAVVLGGPAALRLARAGSPAQAAPLDAARAASDAQVAALFETCLVAGGIGRRSGGSRWALSVTP